MSVLALKLINFMAFRETPWLTLAPITLLFGRNSSGKSAVIRAIRLLKQSLDAKVNASSLQFVQEDGLDQGRFHTTIHQGGAVSPFITFGFRCALANSVESLRDAINERRNPDDRLTSESMKTEGYEWADLYLTFVWTNDFGTQLQKVEIVCPWAVPQADKDNGRLFTAERCEIPHHVSSELADASVSVNQDPLSKKLEEPWTLTFGDIAELGDEEVFFGTLSLERSGLLPILRTRPSVLRSGEEGADVLLSVINEMTEGIQTWLSACDHIGPLRPEPQRAYPIDEITITRWKRRGLGAFATYLTQEIANEQVMQIDRWLFSLKLGDQLDVERRSIDVERASLASVYFRETSIGNRTNIKDVGLGASQVIPIVVSAIAADNNQLLIIEQPELHLHPSAQAELADLFISISNSGRARFLIETHSENLLLRLRRRLAETSGKRNIPVEVQLNSKIICAYFVDRQHGASTIQELAFDEWGDYIERPARYGDFFGQDFQELANMKIAQRGRE